MLSKSYSNLLDLLTGDFPTMKLENKRLSRVMTVPGNVNELETEQTQSVSTDSPSTITQDRMIIVANQLPIVANRGLDGTGWIFSYDEDSLLLQLRDGLPDDTEVFYVGSLLADVDSSEQDSVAQILLDSFKCVPAFLPPDLCDRYYNGFCKKQLWPLFHYMLPYSAGNGGRFDRSLWEDYVSVNRLFAEKVIEVLNPDDDYVWIHDYHLMALPTFLRRRFHQLRMGFFLHSPFPSSEIYRTLPVREEIIRSLLNADLIGFHTFDYARHFLSCCSRMLGLEYQSKRGYLGLEYNGRTIGVKIMPVGVHVGRIELCIKRSEEEMKISQLRQQFDGKSVLLGVDDLDLFQGINLKLLAMEQLLKQHETLRGRVVLVQIINSESIGSDVQEMVSEIGEISQRINKEYGKPGYEPVVIIHRPVSCTEKMAYYTTAECVVVTAVRDGLNLIPYEYIVCREGISGSESSADVASGPRKSMIVVSEFIGCSPSLSGAIRVNPWNVEATAETMNAAISISDSEKQLQHVKHYRYVSSRNVGYWARSFVQDLQRSCSDHFMSNYWGTGLGFGFRVFSIDPNLGKLSLDAVESAYKVCADSKNMIFIVSGRGKDSLSGWFSPCKKLGIGAEHGYFLRWPENKHWERFGHSTDFGWMQIAEPVMIHYTEASDGSHMECKQSALVWHYQDAHGDFGSAQGKEMLDHLERVLANESVVLKKGQFIVELKPQGINLKLLAMEEMLKQHETLRGRVVLVQIINSESTGSDVQEIMLNNDAHNGFVRVVEAEPSDAVKLANRHLGRRTRETGIARQLELARTRGWLANPPPSLPMVFTWRSGKPKVFGQLRCQTDKTCLPEAMIACLEALNALETGIFSSFSVQEIVEKVPNYSQHSDINKWVLSNGVSLRKDYPDRFQGYKKPLIRGEHWFNYKPSGIVSIKSKNEEGIMTALRRRPLLASLRVLPDFKKLSHDSSFYRLLRSEYNSNPKKLHAVVLCAWDESRWHFRNSHGQWGSQGFGSCRRFKFVPKEEKYALKHVFFILGRNEGSSDLEELEKHFL